MASRVRLQSLSRYSLMAAGLTAVGLSLVACSTDSVYRPKGSVDGIGYSDQQIAPMRYRVSFSGSRDTPRTRVEDFLMRRAAEITVQAGYTHFYFDNRATAADTQFYTVNDSWDPNTGLGFGLGRRHAERSEYFASWSFPTQWSPDKAAPLTRYTASSDIVILTPVQAAQTPTALSARDILIRLAPAAASGGPVADAGGSAP